MSDGEPAAWPMVAVAGGEPGAAGRQRVRYDLHMRPAIAVARWSELSGTRVEVQLSEPHRIDGRSVDLNRGVFKYLDKVLERRDSLSRSPSLRLTR